MLKKYLLLGCAIGALTACGGGEKLDYGPENTSQPTPTPEPPNVVYDWSFTDASELDDWTIEFEKLGPEPAELYHQDTRFALGIKTWWGEEPNNRENPAWTGNNWDYIEVYGTYPEPMDVRAGTLFISVYYPVQHLGNPWGSDPWGPAAHHLGTQFVLVDSEGRKAHINTGSSTWNNSFSLLSSNLLRSDARSTAIGPTTQGVWLDLAIPIGLDEDPAGDDDAGFDITSVTGAGVRFNYAFEFPENIGDQPEYADGTPEQYLFIDDVALKPYEGDAIPTPEPPAPGQPPEFGLPVYLDEVEEGFSQWNGWGGNYDFASTTFRKSGTAAIEMAFDGGYGAVQFGASDQDLSVYSSFHLSIFTPVGTAAAPILVQLCGSDSGCGDNDGVQVTTVEGEWAEFDLNLADFPAIDVLKEIRVKNYSGDSKTLYMDEIGFDKVMANISFDIPVYEDELGAGFAQWDGWGGTYDFASGAVVESGSSAIEADWAASSYGAIQMGVSDVDLSGQGTLHFSAYVAEGGDSSILVQLCSAGSVGCGDNDGVQVTAIAGEWTAFTIPLADFDVYDFTSGALTEMRLKNYSDAAKLVYFDNIGFDLIYGPKFESSIFEDAVGAGFAQWDGWGGTYDFASSAQVKSGDVAIEADWAASSYGAIQFGVTAKAVAQTDVFHVSGFLADAAPDSTILVQLCGTLAGGTDTIGCGDNDGVQFVLTAGSWMDFSLALSDFPEIDTLTEIRLKNYSDQAKVVYFDDIGLNDMAVLPSTLDVYYDAVGGGFSQWDGWGGDYTFGQTDMVFHGTAAIQADWAASSYGAIQFGAGDQAIADYSTFHVAIYLEEGQADASILVQLCGTLGSDTANQGCGDNDGVQVSAVAGKWNIFNLDVADFPAFDTLKEIRIKNYSDGEKTVYLDSIGFN